MANAIFSTSSVTLSCPPPSSGTEAASTALYWARSEPFVAPSVAAARRTNSK